MKYIFTVNVCMCACIGPSFNLCKPFPFSCFLFLYTVDIYQRVCSGQHVKDTRQYPGNILPEVYYLRNVYQGCSFVLGDLYLGKKIFSTSNGQNSVQQLSNIVRVQGQVTIRATMIFITSLISSISF